MWSSNSSAHLALCGLIVGAALAGAQAPQPAAPPAPVSPPTAPAPDPDQPVLPKGQILIQSHGEPPLGGLSAPPGDPGQASQAVPTTDAKVDVSDAERSALTFTGYDLDARLDLARSGLAMRARVTVRNDGSTPLGELALQLSSTLHWDSATLIDDDRRTQLTLAQHKLDTDADHTGAAEEAVLRLPTPLAPGASASLDLFYSGTVTQSGDRLARLGAGPAQGRSADWDSISPEWTGLRGFGDVLWYPVASPQLFLADGNTLFLAVGRTRRREQTAVVRMRLSVTYTGEPPAAAYFCGRRQELKSLADTPDAATATGTGLATAEFTPEPLGFRLPSLFVIQGAEALAGGPGAPATGGQAFSSSSDSNPSAGGATGLRTRPAPFVPATDSPVVAVASTDPGIGAGLGSAADHAASLLVDWLGPRPLSALTVLDHDGQPFQDGPLLVAPAATLETSPQAPALVYSLTHAWVQTGQPWMDEGLAQFFALLWVEREQGRDVALSQLHELMQPVALAEPNLEPGSASAPGQPLIAAPDELFYRRKAAAVWWMLRDVAGEKPLRAALSAWRTQPESQAAPEAQALGFQHLLEKLSGKDLGQVFADWVLHDRGLPDLSITDVATSQTPAGPGHTTGYLLAVTVRNEGGSVADVPLTVRSGQFSTTQRMRIPGFGQSTERVLVESTPTEIVVNDGSTPEIGSSTHLRQLTLRTK